MLPDFALFLPVSTLWFVQYVANVLRAPASFVARSVFDVVLDTFHTRDPAHIRAHGLCAGT